MNSVGGASRLLVRGTTVTYGAGRTCSQCGATILSVYNSTVVCASCSRTPRAWEWDIYGPDGYPLVLSLLDLRILYILEAAPCTWLRLHTIIGGVRRRRIGERVRHLRRLGYVIYGSRHRGYFLAGEPASQGRGIFPG